ncbi:hypothetical protein FIBSPDRAFT_993438 [Athelia psychrophila]|uniref:Secreted protein n=1 Tax=Athelia psychrophila TaxID=1759441 RepID=A0A165YC40_9AGAM|nr:hypothetical protein FIBSPDRAFT_993438 [Fibularhizoctonia sp. CBS 109695]
MWPYVWMRSIIVWLYPMFCRVISTAVQFTPDGSQPHRSPSQVIPPLTSLETVAAPWAALLSWLENSRVP